MKMIDLVEEYLQYRKNLGFNLKAQSVELKSFAHFADRRDFTGPLTNQLMFDWAISSSEADPTYHAKKLGYVRQFAKHRLLFDDKTEIPPTGILGRSQIRKPPHIYSDEEVQNIASAFDKLSEKTPHMCRTYKTITGLMLCTGLRISEVFNLYNEDVDLEKGILKIVETKYQKTRLVPIHPSTAQALMRYKTARDELFPRAKTNMFFVGIHGQNIAYHSIQPRYWTILNGLGYKEKGKRSHRLHDLRHSFIVRRLVKWHEEGLDTEQKIAALSVYVGHSKVTDTYWYFSAVPELMNIVGKRFESYQGVTDA